MTQNSWTVVYLANVQLAFALGKVSIWLYLGLLLSRVFENNGPRMRLERSLWTNFQIRNLYRFLYADCMQGFAMRRDKGKWNVSFIEKRFKKRETLSNKKNIRKTQDMDCILNSGSLTTEVKELARNKLNWVCVQEVRWKKPDTVGTEDYIFVGKEMKFIN